MTDSFDELGEVKRQIKSRLIEVLQIMTGVNAVPGRKLSCPNPSHNDSDPSCVVYNNSSGPIIVCNGCDLRGDTFKLNHYLTGAPISGPDFIKQNVEPLAKMLGIDMPKKNLTPKEQYFRDVRRAYAAAEKLLMVQHPSELVQARLSRMGWSAAVRENLGIGSVDYQFLEWHLIHQQRFDAEFLKRIGILRPPNRPQLFGTHLLTFTLKDEHGQAVGFSSRNLYYEDYKNNYKHIAKQFGMDSEQARAAKEAIPEKYYNSLQGREDRDGSPLLHKGERLFGFHTAKLSGLPLYIFEGYADVSTAHHFGLKNSCGVSSAGLTQKQLELILKYKIPHIVLCMDADAGGMNGIRTFLRTLRSVKLPEWFFAEIMMLPQGTDDPDEYIRNYGIESFRALPKWDSFAWEVKSLMESSPSAQDVRNKVVEMLMSEPSPLRRFLNAQTAGQVLGVPPYVLVSESDFRSGSQSSAVDINVFPDGRVRIHPDLIRSAGPNPPGVIDCRARVIFHAKEPDLADDCIYYYSRTQ